MESISISFSSCFSDSFFPRFPVNTQSSTTTNKNDTMIKYISVSLITFTTIGLGDYAPAFGSDRTQTQKFFGYFLFGIGTMIGLALLSSVLAGIESIVHEYHVAMAKKLAEAAAR